MKENLKDVKFYFKLNVYNYVCECGWQSKALKYFPKTKRIQINTRIEKGLFPFKHPLKDPNNATLYFFSPVFSLKP